MRSDLVTAGRRRPSTTNFGTAQLLQHRRTQTKRRPAVPPHRMNDSTNSVLGSLFGASENQQVARR